MTIPKYKGRIRHGKHVAQKFHRKEYRDLDVLGLRTVFPATYVIEMLTKTASYFDVFHLN